ncbi:hypothetical protein AALO_G00173400 [Alosa alosa]|uniref:Uncharacterized protein n=1 Tax=Alosa alosa TaxID=278164 RepID=A0AAV6G7F3_9TELE|nr:hypothetical protein AALO_G00173400 [Alosa alosa]
MITSQSTKRHFQWRRINNWTVHMARRAGVRFLLLCLLTATASSLNCTVHLRSDGSALYQLSEQALPECDVDWIVNGANVATEDDVDHSLVLQRTADYVLLKAYYSNTTYTEDCLVKGLRKVFCDDPIPSGLSEASHDDRKWTWIIIPAVVASLVLVILLVIIWGWKKGWFRRGEDPGKPSEKKELTSCEKIV